MQYRNWIWLGMGVDTEAVCIVITEDSTVFHYWPQIVRAKFFSMVKMQFLLDPSSKTPALRMTWTLRRFVNGRNKTGASYPPLTPCRRACIADDCWLSTEFKRLKLDKFPSIEKKYGKHMKVASWINVKFLIILVFVVTVLKYKRDDVCKCTLFRVLYVQRQC
jgi:hypothetical protein